uniref:nesprin-3 isoform X2 n=1 Tax=Pristiophorus japonicus TaxID=55135 RepID=UPI00398F471D
MSRQEASGEFQTSWEEAQRWMLRIQERLQASDSVQGPKAALEARLRETQEIAAEEPEGRIRLQAVLLKAESLLQDSNTEEKRQIHTALKQIKCLWEDTKTHMVHCHSRIEWVLLHWSEYLRAREDYFIWLLSLKQKLEPDLESQLGLKEKKLQLNHHRIVLSNISNQAALLQRLIQESASLFAKTQDGTLSEEAQHKLKADHEELEIKSKEKVAILEAIVQEHQEYSDNQEKFQNWLTCMKEKYNNCSTCKDSDDRVEVTLRELRELDAAVGSKEGELGNLQTQAKAVIQNTSPMGAERITRDLEELRKDWQDLRLRCQQDQGPLELALQALLDSRSRAQQLAREVAELQDHLRSLDLEPTDANELETALRKCLITRSSILAEEPRVEEFQLKLKELFRASQNDKVLSDKVLSVIREYRRMKRKIVERTSQLGVRLRQDFQELLREFQQWRSRSQNLLHASLDPEDGTQISVYLQHLQDHLAHSSRLDVQLDRFQGLEGMLSSIFSEEQSAALGCELREAVQQHGFLSDSLRQRRKQLQTWLCQLSDFVTTNDTLRGRLDAFKTQLTAERRLLPNLQTKRAQQQHLESIAKDLTVFEAELTDLHSSVSLQPHRSQLSPILAECRLLSKSLKAMIKRSGEVVLGHEQYQHSLCEVEQWISRAQRQCKAHRWTSGGDATSSSEAEQILTEFPEKEILFHWTRAQGDLVLSSTSPDGSALIEDELQRLWKAWGELQLLGMVSSSQTKAGELGVGHEERFHHQLARKVYDRAPTDLKVCMKKFQEWLKAEDCKLTNILIARSPRSSREREIRKRSLKVLRSRVPQGQKLFEELLGAESAGVTDEKELEDLRYRWILYKTQLREIGELQIQGQDEVDEFRKTSRGLWHYLSRACCAALPLQLLLLLLLFLAFLLPLIEEQDSCSVVNNFARSFYLTLRYQGPPPT